MILGRSEISNPIGLELWWRDTQGEHSAIVKDINFLINQDGELIYTVDFDTPTFTNISGKYAKFFTTREALVKFYSWWE